MLKNPENEQPRTIRLADYEPTPFAVTKIELHFELDAAQTSVKTKLSICRNESYHGNSSELQLHGQELILKGLVLDGKVLRDQDYTVDDSQLCIFNVPDEFVLEVQTEISPIENTTLNGLYLSSGNFCTQCEAEGFRRITYMYDRPDVMARYTTTIVADPVKFPILLSNGNRVEQGTLGDGRHWVKWQDPFPKPTYLFALVAGDLACIEDRFVTRSGRDVLLQIYVEHHNKDKCQHAMHSLINSMRWDEEVFGREYDLDIYMIVAVDDFNMGAMENKGLNVFNSKYVLAKPDTATDGDYQGIEGVIGHEYFHNWSGNRVTCRDWFQLSLKEGFTVFRDQQFSADMSSKGVKRIQDVNILRSYQFREDAGPMAHPIRPESYVEINNFYTMTVYNKGAEVVRMLFHLLGEEGFRNGTDLYFSRHDGQAVTTDDFVKALEDANAVDLTQFKFWYSQAGTPVLDVSPSYDEKDKTYTLSIKQHCPDTPGQSQKQAFHIPISMGLLGSDGKDLPLQLQGESDVNTGTQVLHLKEFEQSFIFVNVQEKPVPSLLRSFSAPVKLQIDLTDDERCFLMGNDNDDFNRWDAGQQLAIKIIVHLVKEYQNDRELLLDDGFIAAYKKILLNKSLDKALAAQALALPAETYISDFIDPIDPEAIHEVRCFVRKQLATELKPIFQQIYDENTDQGPYKIDQESIARRKLKNCALAYLMELGDETITQNCVAQFKGANNMTDVICALSNLVNNSKQESELALQQFYTKWRDDPLVVDKWLGLQAGSRLPGALSNVEKLIQHESFTIKNPNKVRALIGGFCSNLTQFHAKNGEGYRFISDYVIKIDALNPQISSRLVNVFSLWKKYDPDRQKLMKEQLEKIINTPNLSKDVHEIVSKSLL
jgi:aminopeptidase N